MSTPEYIPETSENPARQGLDAVTRLTTHAQELLKAEMAFAKAEVSRNLTRAGIGLAFLAIAFMLALTATEVLAASVVAGLVSLGMTPGWAALALGAAFLIVAGVLATLGISRLKLSALTPDRTLDNLSDDFDAVKGKHHG